MAAWLIHQWTVQPIVSLSRYLVVAEEVWDLSRCEEVVDEDEEALVGHLRVRHQEHRAQVLEPRLLVQVGQVQLQVGARVALAQGHLKVVHVVGGPIALGPGMKLIYLAMFAIKSRSLHIRMKMISLLTVTA